MQNLTENNKQWYVLYVNVKHEKKVFNKLCEQKIEGYLPLVKTVKQWSDRKKSIEEPLFTGYVFVKLLPHELDKPLYIKGVLNYLCFGKQKAIVQPSEIDSLKYLTQNGYNLSIDEGNIKIGSKVKLLLSSFKDKTATVQSINNESAIVYFESLRQNLKVKAPVSALEIISYSIND